MNVKLKRLQSKFIPFCFNRNMLVLDNVLENKGYDEIANILTYLFSRLNLSQVKSVCHILDVEKKGVRDEIVERLMAFLMAPKSTGKSVPQKSK